MVKKLIMYSLASFLLFSSAFSETFSGPTNLSWRFFDSLVIYGPAKVKMVKAKTLEVKGDLEFNHLDVAQSAEITGNVKGESGKFGKLNVIGPFDIDHVATDELEVVGPVKAIYLNVSSNAEIVGPLDVQHGKFQNLTVTADTITLDDVTADKITIKNDHKPQTLILKGSSVIGDLTFESGDGQVQKDPQAQIKGNVKGATVSQF